MSLLTSVLIPPPCCLRFEWCVVVSSAFNMCKWNVLSIGMTILALELLVWLWVGLGFSAASKRRGEDVGEHEEDEARRLKAE